MAELHREHHYLTTASRQKARVHPSSILSGKPRARYVVYSELVTTGKTYMRTVTNVEPDWIEEIVPNVDLLKKLFINHNLIASVGRKS